MTKNKNKTGAPKSERRKVVQGSKARYGVSQMEGAPAGVSQDLQQFTRFLPGSKPDSIKMHVCAPVTQLLRQTSQLGGGAIIDSNSQPGISLQMNLTEPAILLQVGTKTASGYTSPIFDLIASAFVRYRIRKLVFHYEPQSAATAGDRMVFAFANDPLHPVLWNATIPTASSLLSLADSIAFMPWRAWSMDVTKRVGDTEYYTYSNSSATVTEFTERFSDFGVISAVTSTSNTPPEVIAGVLYAEMVVELSEFCPISVTRPALLKALAVKADVHANRNGLSSQGMPKEQGPSVVDHSDSTTQGPESETEKRDRLLAMLESVTKSS